MQYKKAGLGGTFDHFHIGHQEFLRQAAQVAEHLVIGITDPKLITTKLHNAAIEKYEVREKSVTSFCQAQGWSFETVRLKDVYGPTLTDNEINVIFVSETTVNGAKEINKKRNELNLTTLPVVKGLLLRDKADEVISSERIRAGAINRAGKIYKSVLKEELHLTEVQRLFFSKPQGEVITEPSDAMYVCLVGDSTVETFLQNSWSFNVAVFDFKMMRKEYRSPLIDKKKIDIVAVNQAGNISLHLVKALELAIKKKYSYLFVDGEEDLAAVAAMLLLPLGSVIYYGQPNLGIIRMDVTETRKDEFFTVFST